MAEWQPIESAPKNGMCVPLFLQKRARKAQDYRGGMDILRHHDEYLSENDLEARSEPGWYETSWASEEAHRVEGEPTYWMLLPDSPPSGDSNAT